MTTRPGDTQASLTTNPIFYLLALGTLAGFLVTPYLIFHVAPLEPNMGFIQKIFYYHVPCAWVMLLAAIIGGISGGIYLFARKPWADRLSVATGEITVVFGILVLTTGPLWAKKAWGHYWVWDARLTTMMILFLTAVGLVLVRRYTGTAARRIAAGVAMFGAANVPLVYLSVKIWKTNHPGTQVASTLSPAMRSSLWLSVATFSVLFALILWARLRLERLQGELEDLAVAVGEHEAARAGAPPAKESR